MLSLADALEEHLSHSYVYFDVKGGLPALNTYIAMALKCFSYSVSIC